MTGEELSEEVARRLQRELGEVRDRRSWFGWLRPREGRLRSLRGEVRGPPGSPYRSGRFRVGLRLDKYPHRPPRVRFLTPVWHPNVERRSGLVCLDVLAERWDQHMSLRAVLLSLQALLATPEMDDPLETRVSGQYARDPGLFQLTAAFWTREYAGGELLEDLSPLQEKVAILESRGCSRRVAVDELSENDWDLDLILNQ